MFYVNKVFQDSSKSKEMVITIFGISKGKKVI